MIPTVNLRMSSETFVVLFSQVDDQMKLLQNRWCQLLIVDFVCRQSRNNKHDDILLVGSGWID